MYRCSKQLQQLYPVEGYNSSGILQLKDKMKNKKNLTWKLHRGAHLANSLIAQNLQTVCSSANLPAFIEEGNQKSKWVRKKKSKNTINFTQEKKACSFAWFILILNLNQFSWWNPNYNRIQETCIFTRIWIWIKSVSTFYFIISKCRIS